MKFSFYSSSPSTPEVGKTPVDVVKGATAEKQLTDEDTSTVGIEESFSHSTLTDSSCIHETGVASRATVSWSDGIVEASSGIDNENEEGGSEGTSDDAKINDDMVHAHSSTLAGSLARITREISIEGNALLLSTSSSDLDSPASQPKQTESPACVPHLAAMMQARIDAMDDIRALLRREGEAEGDIRTMFAARVRELEKDRVSREEEMKALRRKVGDLEEDRSQKEVVINDLKLVNDDLQLANAKLEELRVKNEGEIGGLTTTNEGYAQQIEQLTSTVNDLVNNNYANIERMAEMERDLDEKSSIINQKEEEISDLKANNEDYTLKIEQMSGAINELVDSKAEMELDLEDKLRVIKEINNHVQETQAMLDKKIEEMEVTTEENRVLEGTVGDLKAKNAQFVTQLESVMSSLDEMVEDNSSLETQVRDLTDAKRKFEEENAELIRTIEKLTASLRAEKESAAGAFANLERVLEDTTTQMTVRLESRAKWASLLQQIPNVGGELPSLEDDIMLSSSGSSEC